LKAAADALGVTLVSSDERLVSVGLAETPGATGRSLSLPGRA
jgi:hypothetical protein